MCAAASRHPLVNKATPLYRDDLIAMHETVFQRWDSEKIIDISELRSLVRANIIYFSFCRGHDYNCVKDKHVSLFPDYIKIVFPKSKNDQFYDNSYSFIPTINDKYCPVKLLKFYFQFTGLTFENPAKRCYYLNFTFHCMDRRPRPILMKYLSVNNSVAKTRALLAKSGKGDRHYTDKSFKVGGVSDYMHKGKGTLTETMVHGRWNNESTPMYYRNEDPRYRLKLARKLVPK